MTNAVDFQCGILGALTHAERDDVKRQIAQKIRVWTTLGAVTDDGPDNVQSVLIGVRDGLDLRTRFHSGTAEEVYNDNVRHGFIDGTVTDIPPDGVDHAAYDAGRSYAWEIKRPERVCARKPVSTRRLVHSS